MFSVWFLVIYCLVLFFLFPCEIIEYVFFLLVHLDLFIEYISFFAVVLNGICALISYRELKKNFFNGVLMCWIPEQKKALICSIWRFPWCKYSQHGQFQVTNTVSLNADLGRDEHKFSFQSQLLHTRARLASVPSL